MAPESCDEQEASCICRITGLKWTRTPTQSEAAAWTPDDERLHKNHNQKRGKYRNCH